jgi:RecG-like helicase
VTIVPFHIDTIATDLPVLLAPGVLEAEAGPGKATKATKAAKKRAKVPTINLGDFELPEDRTRIKDLEFREKARVAGKVYSMRVQPWSGVAALELTIIDDTGALLIVFFGRRQLPGVTTGSRLVVEGMVGEHRNTMAMLNPAYEIKLDPHAGEALPTHG